MVILPGAALMGAHTPDLSELPYRRYHTGCCRIGAIGRYLVSAVNATPV